MSVEAWAPLPGDWRYQISNHGRVRSYCSGPPKLLRCSIGRYVTLRTDGVTRYVHELVLTAFAGPRPPGAVCRHLNDDPHDNRAENLAWGTYEENAADALRNGRAFGRSGAAHAQAKLTDDDVREIMRLREKAPTTAARFGISPWQVRHIRKRRQWAHVACDPKDVEFWGRRFAGREFREAP